MKRGLHSCAASRSSRTSCGPHQKTFHAAKRARAYDRDRAQIAMVGHSPGGAVLRSVKSVPRRGCCCLIRSRLLTSHNKLGRLAADPQ